MGSSIFHTHCTDHGCMPVTCDGAKAAWQFTFVCTPGQLGSLFTAALQSSWKETPPNLSTTLITTSDEYGISGSGSQVWAEKGGRAVHPGNAPGQLSKLQHSHAQTPVQTLTLCSHSAPSKERNKAQARSSGINKQLPRQATNREIGVLHFPPLVGFC
jgi:hypothetical protein